MYSYGISTFFFPWILVLNQWTRILKHNSFTVSSMFVLGLGLSPGWSRLCYKAENDLGPLIWFVPPYLALCCLKLLLYLHYLWNVKYPNMNLGWKLFWSFMRQENCSISRLIQPTEWDFTINANILSTEEEKAGKKHCGLVYSKKTWENIET